MTDINAILTERNATYGDFTLNANASQALKSTYRAHCRGGLVPLHYEALDLICTKISRIITGGNLSAYHADSWDDIAGYAKLVADRVR